MSLSWCAPAIVFAAMSVLKIAAVLYQMFAGSYNLVPVAEETKKKMTTFNVSTLLYLIVWTVVWMWVILKLCSSGHTGWAWFFVILPIILGVMVLLLMFSFVEVLSRLPAKVSQQPNEQFQPRQQMSQPRPAVNYQQPQQHHQQRQQPQQMSTPLSSLSQMGMNVPAPMGY